MNVKVLIVLTIVLSSLFILPVNATLVTSKIPNTVNLGINPAYNDLIVSFEYLENTITIYKDLQVIISDDYATPYMYYSEDGLTTYIKLQDIINNYGVGFYEIEYNVFDEEFGKLWEFTIVESAGDYDIIIENNVNNIDIGNTTDLNHAFTIGSRNNGNILNITSYSAYNCYLESINNNYCIVVLDLDLSQSSINFAGNVDYNGNIQTFETSAVFSYNYHEPIEPTIEPTAQPTPDDLSRYGEKKNFQIRNIDYLQGTQLNGANLTIYYTDINDNIVTNPIYHSNSAPAVIDLRVPIAGGLFVEYGITPNYEPVKIQTYPALNNKVGYWINQEISDYENLYYQYYDTDNPLTDINYGITLIDGNTHLPVSNAAINIDGSNTQYTSNYGGTVFKNITQGLHTFTVNKQGYNSLTFTKNIVITSSTEIEFFPISVIPTATITPSPVKPITPSPTISPIDKPSNILESVSYGLAKVFGVKTVDNANYIFALLIILFPAAIAGGITHQALGFIAGGMLGFVFALTIGLIPIWTFFAMCLLAVIYIMLIRGNEGF